MRLVGVIVVLLVLAIGGLAGYAYLGDMKAAPTEMRVPVELDLGAAVPAPAADAEPEAEAPPAAPAAEGADEQVQPQANDLD